MPFSCMDIFLTNIRIATKSKTAHFPCYFQGGFSPFQAGFVLQPRQSFLIISAYFLYQLPFTDTMEIIEESEPFTEIVLCLQVLFIPVHFLLFHFCSCNTPIQNSMEIMDTNRNLNLISKDSNSSKFPRISHDDEHLKKTK